jgi:tRNA(Ile)-lysidine synthase
MLRTGLRYNEAIMNEVLHNILELNAAHDLLPRGETVVVGVSGGPDSLCLVHALHTLRGELGIAPHVATLDHGLRGEASAADAAFVEATARAWGLPVTAGRADVPALEERLKLGVEETARQARYTFLAQVAAEQGARVIAAAHNADDQSETVLMHFLRGSGLAGLRGMLPATRLSEYHLLPDALDPAPFTLARPLLTTPRAAVEAYCAAHDLRPRFDRSNLDVTLFRNRLRREIIPYLEQVNPNLRALLRHTADVATADYAALRAGHARAWAAACRDVQDDAVTFDLAGWRALSLSAQRATLREAAFRIGRSLRDVSFTHVDNAVSIARRGETGARATLPGGLYLRVDYDALVVAAEHHTPAPPPWPLLWSREPLPVPPAPSVVALPGNAWHFRLARCRRPLPAGIHRETWRAVLALPPDAELVLRTRRPGDRFAPQGMGGHTQKLADFMINVKIPAPWRDYIPLLVAGGIIVWVVGWRVSQYCVVTDDNESFFVADFMEPS